MELRTIEGRPRAQVILSVAKREHEHLRAAARGKSLGQRTLEEVILCTEQWHPTGKAKFQEKHEEVSDGVMQSSKDYVESVFFHLNHGRECGHTPLRQVQADACHGRGLISIINVLGAF